MAYTQIHKSVFLLTCSSTTKDCPLQWGYDDNQPVLVNNEWMNSMELTISGSTFLLIVPVLMTIIVIPQVFVHPAAFSILHTLWKDLLIRQQQHTKSAANIGNDSNKRRARTRYLRYWNRIPPVYVHWLYILYIFTSTYTAQQQETQREREREKRYIGNFTSSRRDVMSSGDWRSPRAHVTSFPPPHPQPRIISERLAGCGLFQESREFDPEKSPIRERLCPSSYTYATVVAVVVAT